MPTILREFDESQCVFIPESCTLTTTSVIRGNTSSIFLPHLVSVQSIVSAHLRVHP